MCSLCNLSERIDARLQFIIIIITIIEAVFIECTGVALM